MRATRPARGFLLLDASIALAVVVILMAAMAITLGHYRSGMKQLADQRAASRLAEAAVLARLGGGPEPTVQRPEATVEVRPLEEKAPPGRQWVEARARWREREARVVALVPESAAVPASPTQGAKP